MINPVMINNSIELIRSLQLPNEVKNIYTTRLLIWYTNRYEIHISNLIELLQVDNNYFKGWFNL